jgi:hypothetical protein
MYSITNELPHNQQEEPLPLPLPLPLGCPS